MDSNNNESAKNGEKDEKVQVYNVVKLKEVFL